MSAKQHTVVINGKQASTDLIIWANNVEPMCTLNAEVCLLAVY